MSIVPIKPTAADLLKSLEGQLENVVVIGWPIKGEYLELHYTVPETEANYMIDQAKAALLEAMRDE